jgi:hypothetical protein
MTIGGLTKKYSDNPEGAPQSLVYGNVACIFLFQGAYSMAWTPLYVIHLAWIEHDLTPQYGFVST